MSKQIAYHATETVRTCIQRPLIILTTPFFRPPLLFTCRCLPLSSAATSARGITRSYHFSSHHAANNSDSSGKSKSNSSRKSSSSSPPSGRVKIESATMFGADSTSSHRISSMSHGGQLAPAAAPIPAALNISAASSSALLNPQRVNRGVANKSIILDRELHAPNRGVLNHALSRQIEKHARWDTLLPLLFDHMHHMTLHNYVRAMKKLGE